MNKKRIESPKVFISYAWGTKEYQDKVLAFATQLRRDGVDVVIDKWDLSEGNDTIAFMQNSINDKTVTNVLMLIDPVYAQKADDFSGGVGTETQIISPKVYKEVTQDRFIPIVFMRDEAGKICKPTYLQCRLHFDLSLVENYDEEYRRLVRTLYGEETYKKAGIRQQTVMG
ncbi:MAG: TIR domain-containing protein [Saccharofermentans sp.]|nr:TIR domain-containing protein [Saccharofermentans sp.]